jgi:hypothetical protein
MRSGQVIGGALLVLALGAADDAEARGRGGRSGSRGGTVLVSTGSAAGVASARYGSDQATMREPGLRPVMPVTAPAPLQREVRAAEPWCANQRVVGSGAGFCVIN